MISSPPPGEHVFKSVCFPVSRMASFHATTGFSQGEMEAQGETYMLELENPDDGVIDQEDPDDGTASEGFNWL